MMINIVIYLIYLTSIYADDSWSNFQASDIYPKYDLKNCKFPFNFNGKSYNNCTIDGTNGNIPWCSITTDYVGLFTYCYDFRATTLQCSFPFQMNGKTFNECSVLSKKIPYKQCRSNNPNYPYRYCFEQYTKKSDKPLFNLDGCDPAYKAISKLHSKCAGPSDYAVAITLTDDDKSSIVDTHNGYRAEVGATYMFKLYWDDVLADMAQTHANMCAFDHDLSDNRITLKYPWKNGQNMVMTTDMTSSLADLLRSMYDSEKPRLSYGVGCNPAGTCTHYTQLMLSNLTRLGCGLTHCIFPDHIERYLVCNYILSQYTDKYMTPFVQGSAGSACPDKKDSNNLCDCGNKICQYDKGESLDPNTCQCKGGSRKRSLDENQFQRRADEESAGVEGKGQIFQQTYDPDEKSPEKREIDHLSGQKRLKRTIRKIKFQREE